MFSVMLAAPAGLAPSPIAPGAAGPAARSRRGRSPAPVAGLLLALVFALGAGCAKRQALVAPAATPAASSSHTEIAELEKTITDNKARLRGGDHPAASAPAADSAPSSMAAGAGPVTRCDGVCRAAQEICTASRRICQISLDLADTAIANSCQRAERACVESSTVCAQCR